MSEGGSSPGAVKIGSVTFEPDSGDLRGPDDRHVRLAPQPARLLALFVERRGEVVSRADVGNHLWPHGAVEVDQGIGYAVREVRKAIEDVGGDPTLVETIPRRGFRINGVEPADAKPSEPLAVPRTLMLGGVLLAGLAVMLMLWAGVTAEPVIAVFAYDSPDDSASLALADRLDDVLTTELFREFGGEAGVVGPTGTSRFEGPDDAESLRREIGACLVLSGGIRVAADTGVIVFTQAVRSADRVHVWASMDTVSGVDPLDQVVPRILQGVRDVVHACR